MDRVARSRSPPGARSVPLSERFDFGKCVATLLRHGGQHGLVLDVNGRVVAADLIEHEWMRKFDKFDQDLVSALVELSNTSFTEDGVRRFESFDDEELGLIIRAIHKGVV